MDLTTIGACTLPTPERPLRVAEFEALFAASARSVTRDGLELTIRLAGADGLLGTVRDLAERETACCSFFTFLLVGGDDDLTMTISVPPEQVEVLDALAARAVELSA